ncbi:BTB/POZ domain-containing protein 2 [Orchesella cincta]|uniref:BTB/POZ domain-containing protein 2 n=1 Tax=Orchesella cincta TaxID=48709 RepID=A0A1D2N8F9_ORCCI|nr:BTB/POZ domain-containing protein 2 [Orchesella cincta]
MDFPRTKVGSNVLGQGMPGVKAKLLEVLKNGFLSDVTFLVGQQETPIEAHKLILAFISPVFEAMFYGPVDEASRETYATIGIPDIEPDAFTLMLEYIYAREIPLRIALQTAIQSVYAARKYALPDMEKMVLRHLLESVTVDTAAILLSTAKLFDLVRLENKCWDCIELDSERFLASEEFHNLDGDLVKTVISRENLGIPEQSIYKSVVRWGERECQRKELTVEPGNVRTMIEKILPQIRFPLMEPSEFANGPARSGILTAEEISNVIITKFATVREKPHPLFSPTKRFTKMDSMGANSKCLCQNKTSTCFYCHPGPYIQHRSQARVTEDVGEQPESDQNRTIVQNPIIGMQNPSSPTYLPSYCSCRTRRYCPEKRAFT